MSRQTSTTALDRTGGRRSRSGAEEEEEARGTLATTSTWRRRRSGWRSGDGDVLVTPPTSPPPQRRQWENSATTRTRNVCYRVVNTGPSESGKRAREREAEATEKTRGRRINGRAKTLAAPRMDIFASHVSPPRPPVLGQNETGEHPLQPSLRDFLFPHSQAQGCFKGRDGLARGLAQANE
jgi:hypothetical protein